MPSMIAAIHDIQAVEIQKERYSRELAAYTLKQWDMARRSLEVARQQQDGKKSSRSSSRRRSATPDSRSSRGSEGIQAADYARRSHKHTTESRTVDPGKA
ncbi:hypothetical protein BXZ70DRAFT_1008011 [Cristinia sonorae]|uniref:Uncharacterized protein n=1 Tax=Cristinia sonorae TaxID=1940300 RepID=A0A8K0XQD4_9AGAR|nr:hypothetical protein BXZ70DRAFT_1008011 [Cristinia sonorae]